MTSTDETQASGVLFVGGVDSSGGAGLDADRDAARAFERAHHEVASALTDQDLFEVRRVEERMMWAREAEALFDGTGGGITAMKFGLLPGVASIVEAARLVARGRHGARWIPAVVDPVIRASSGYRFWTDRELVQARDSLLVSGPILTPNLDELAELTWTDRGALEDSGDARLAAADGLLRAGVSGVVVTGGHERGDGVIRDLVLEPGAAPCWLERERVPGEGIRGSGCRFAAALACGLAAGRGLADSARAAGDFVAGRIRESLS
ncbi:MAG: bifunctional hydroxymethylpyrimidine kinase/phosphomethylpyrimidine kinase [Planctomycetota bacterium]|jgi:hydroxymethylpyrimidine kinase/phosphomethylpyrimidine kinase